MKTRILVTTFALSLLFLSCDTTNSDKMANDSFIDDLTTFSNTKIELFDVSTRNSTDGGGGAISEDAIYELFARIENLSKKHNLSEALLESGYYQDLDESIATMNSYEIMNFFKANSTPEFYKLVSDMIVDNKPVDNSEIIHSKNLLPNEQIALITINNVLESSVKILTYSNAPCTDAYDTGMSRCYRNHALGLVGGALFAIVAPYASVVIFAANSLGRVSII